jgi:hypothetical protein
MMAFVKAPAGSRRLFVDDEREDLVIRGAPHLAAAARAAGQLQALLGMHRAMGAAADEGDNKHCIHTAACALLNERERCTAM